MKPVVLVCYAVEQEFVEIESDDVTFVYCQTGVGKVNAALAVVDAIAAHQPQMVMNVATAGTVLHQVGSIHLCAKFVDRDMEKLAEFGVVFEEDFTADLRLKALFGELYPTSVCNTGDSFLTQGDGTGDVFDMEAFAIARACRVRSIPFVAVKYVTDVIGQNSVKHWADKLADARVGLKGFMENQVVPSLKI